MPNLREKTWTTSTPANVEDAQFWEDHLISNEDASKLENITGVPDGGSSGQVLTKTTSGIEWSDPASSGHTIQNADGVDMPYQGTLQFLGADVANDSANGKTVVDCHGQKGDAATIAAGTVTILPAGSTPTVTNSGTSSDAVFDFGIPSSGGVQSFNGRSGSILPMAGDYDSKKILLSSALHIGGETQNDVQEALEAIVNDGGAGHTILNGLGQEMPQRKNLRFAGANVSDDAENDTTNVTISGGGSGGSTITVTTTETSLYGETVTITDGASTFTGVFDNTGVCVIDGVTATGTLTVTSGGASRTLNVPYFGNYTVPISFWSATINITTDPDIASAIVKKDGVQIGTVNFTSGSGTYIAGSTGAYTFEVTVGGVVFSSPTVTVTEQTTYSTTIDIFSATLSISTSSSELYSKTITIKKGSTVVGTTAFSAQGSATYTVHETGTFTAECEGYSGSATVSAETTYNISINSVNVTLNVTASAADGTTLTATDGTNTETATITNGKAEFNLSAGDWEVAGIPITVEAGQTYEEDVYVFAVHYSETDSSPDSTNYPTGYDNYGWTPFAMNTTTGVPDYGSWNPSGTNASKLAWFYPKSCMLKYDGTVDYYLDEDDESKKADGVTASDVANTSYGGNAMVEWGQDGKRICWTLIPDTNNDGWTFVVSNAEVMGCKAWNHYDADNDLNMHWYMSKYEGCLVSSKVRSISGQTSMVGVAVSTYFTYARNNNIDSAKIWDMDTFCDHLFVAFMCALLARSTNTQSKFGDGKAQSPQVATGTMNAKGMFYGKSGYSDGVKVFGMEHMWGNWLRHVVGLISVSNVIKVKMTHGTQDGSTASDYNLTGEGYLSKGTACPLDGNWRYINHMYVTDKYMIPDGKTGSASTYYCDGGLINAGTVIGALGLAYHTTNDGAFGFCFAYTTSDTRADHTTSLSCKPMAS